jgi:hypothetical protein
MSAQVISFSCNGVQFRDASLLGCRRRCFSRSPTAESGALKTNMTIKIEIGGKVLTATLADNATAQDFVSVLPLKLSMADLFGRERCAKMPKALSEEGPRKKRYEVAEIAYWSPPKRSRDLLPAGW